MATTYTHNFEIKFNGTELSGELSFDAGDEIASVKYSIAPEMNVVIMRRVQAVFEAVRQLALLCDTSINKIEITTKA